MDNVIVGVSCAIMNSKDTELTTDDLALILQDGDFLVEDPEDKQCDGNMVVSAEAEHGQTILFHNGEYYIQTEQGALVLEGANEHFVITDDDTLEDASNSTDPDVIKYLQDNSGGSSLVYGDNVEFLQTEESSMSENGSLEITVLDESNIKKLGMENQLISIEASEDTIMDIGDNFSILTEDGVTSSKFKLAYVKDGQIHLQLCDSNSIDVEEDSTELIESETTNDAESAVTGRNLITGQTVYLNDYLSRLRKRIIRANDCRKHQAGHDKTSSGKRLVARILEIKTPDVKLDIIEHGAETQRDNSDVLRQNESVNIEAVKHHPNIVRGNTKINNRKKIEVLNASLQVDEDNGIYTIMETEDVHDLILSANNDIMLENEKTLALSAEVNEELIEFLSKNLSSLAELETMRKKLLDRELHIKFTEKNFNRESRRYDKVTTTVLGYLSDKDGNKNGSKEKYFFAPLTNKTNEENEFPNEKVKGNFACAGQEKSHNKRFQNKTSLNITVTQNNQGRTVHVSYVDKSEPTPHSNILHGKDFGKSDELVKYMNISQGSPGSKCNICNVTFDNTLRLNKHRRIHAHYLSCGNCRKQFATQSSLKRHMSVHDHTLRPLECSVCKARFSDESSLCKHLIIHSGIRAYQCDICCKTFTTFGDLNFHKRIHDPHKLFSCEVCNRKFSRHSNLLRHIEIHRGENNIFKCDQCGCGYKYVSSLTRHIVQNHVKKS